MTSEEKILLSIAKDNLEHPNFLIKLTDYIGMPIEYAVEKIPRASREIIGDIVQEALRSAYKAAKLTILEGSPSWWQTYLNRASVTLSGGVGGAFGIPGAVVDIPVSTTIFFREMSQNAVLHGFDLRDPKVCVEVMSCFALGGRSNSDDAAESGYYAVRAALAKAVSEAAGYMASKMAGNLADDVAKPVIIQLIEKIAARFGVIVTDEMAAKSVPVIGAVGGIAINNLFINHFSNVSDAHFFILKMEKKYGREVVEESYNNI